MGAKQDQLARLLACVGRVTKRQVARVKAADLERADVSAEVDRVYRRLGGALPAAPGPPAGVWDLEFEGVAVELDEQLHFNRYRQETLASSFYGRLPHFPLAEWHTFCREYEDRCVRAGGHGGKWSNPSCARQFGQAAPEGTLSGGGAPRWKQRAFYDFLKDLAPLLGVARVARLAIWDTLDERGVCRTVEEALHSPTPGTGAALAAMVRRRAGG